MATALDEQILDRVVTKLADINGAGGYETNVPAANIHRPPIAPIPLKATDCPALIVRLFAKTSRWHLRGAEEFVLRVMVLCVVAAPAADANEELSDLIGDVKKLVIANEFWNDGSADLAERTWLVEDFRHETEVDEPTMTGGVVFEVLARSDLTNPSVRKAI